MTEEEKSILEEILNEEIKSYLKSGYSITDNYIISLKNIIKKITFKGDII